MEEAIEIRMSDGVADGFVYRADDGRRQPGIIHLVDIRGVRPAHREMAQRLAAAGYTVVMPNIFYRTGRSPVVPADATEEQRTKRTAELRAPMTREAVERDVSDYVDFLAADRSVADGAMGVVGYCFAGAMAMRTAAMRAARVAAVASFHGGGLYTDSPDSPHRALPRIHAQLYFGHAVEDRACPQRQSKTSTAPSRRGAGSIRVKSMRAPVTGGRCRIVRCTIRRKRSVHLKT